MHMKYHPRCIDTVKETELSVHLLCSTWKHQNIMRIRVIVDMIMNHYQKKVR